MTDIDVRKLNNDEFDIWDELVDTSSHGTIFHKSFWLNICSEKLRKKKTIYGCYNNDKLIGGCSLYINKSNRFFNTASSICEMTPYGGVVLATSTSSKLREKEQAHNTIVHSLFNAIYKEDLENIELVFSPEFIDIRSFTWHGWDSKVLYAYYLNLENDLSTTSSKDVRRNVKRAIENGVTIKKLKDSTIYYDLASMTFSRQNLIPPVPKDLIEGVINILRHRDCGEMWVAEMPSGEIVSAQIILWDKKRAYSWGVASNPTFRGIGISSLIDLTIFQDLKNQGFKEINLMSANTPRIAQYISGLNPMLLPYYSVEKKTRLMKIMDGIYRCMKR